MTDRLELPPRVRWAPVDHRWRESNWLPPRELPIDEWAEENIVLPRAMTALPGPLDLDRTPYLREILRMSQDPDVEEMTLCFGTQLAKTTACIVIVLHSLAEDPWPCLHVMPREDDAVQINTDRYQKVILESPNLRKFLTGAKNDTTREAIRLNGGSVHFASANSPAGLSSRAIAKLILDETDKYPPFSGQEANPIALARERTQTFFDRFILKTSTPTTERGYIWQEYQASDRRCYFLPCPHCGAYQILVMGTGEPSSPGIHWKHDVPVDQIVDDGLAWYECEACHRRIEDSHKPGMLRHGVWVPDGARIGADGSVLDPPASKRRVGYWLSALYSPWRTFGQIAAEFLRSKDYRDLLMNFRNSWLAELWHERVEELRDAHLRDRRTTYKQGEVPRAAVFLTAGVDVQVDHLWYVIRAWGKLGESWLIRAGRCETFEALHAIIFASRYLLSGTDQAVPLRMVLIDAAYRGDEVYAFCRMTGAQAVRGEARPTWPTRETTHTSPDGHIHKLVMINTDYWKCKVHRMIRTTDGDPGAWHLPEDLPEAYFEHLVTEQRTWETNRKTGETSALWRLVRPGAPNHLFDAEVYATAATEPFSLEHRVDITTEAGQLAASSQQAATNPVKERPRFTRPIPPPRRYFRDVTKAYETTSKPYGNARNPSQFGCRRTVLLRRAVA